VFEREDGQWQPWEEYRARDFAGGRNGKTYWREYAKNNSLGVENEIAFFGPNFRPASLHMGGQNKGVKGEETGKGGKIY